MNGLNSKKKLIILPCSKSKKVLTNTQAINLYDGPFYRLIRKYNPSDTEIMILSAKYGLIESTDKISYYDQKMTKDRAKELSNCVSIKLTQKLNENDYIRIYINLGKIYTYALADSMSALNQHNTLFASGRIGERISQLKQWIRPLDDNSS